jgi:hypothetical protein
MRTPVIVIHSPAPTKEHPFVPAVLSSVTVDGEQWPIVAWKIESNVDGVAQVTLTFYADLTVTHAPLK